MLRSQAELLILNMCSKQAIESSGSHKSRIIESAISLFALKGMNNVTLRELTRHANVNLGAVNYHFHTKEALAEVVFMELAARMNGRRVEQLREVLSVADQNTAVPSLEDIVGTFVEPYLRVGDGAQEGQLLAQFVLMHRIAPTPMTHRIIRKHFDPMAKEYIQALGKAAPDVEPREFYWRYVFMVSTVILTVSDRSKGNRLVRLSKGLADMNQRDELKHALVTYIVGGMRAPS